MPTWNVLTDVSDMLSYQFMRSAFEAGAIVAVVAGVVGYFVVLRRTTFAAHALSHIGFAGAAGAAVLGLLPIWGLLASCLGAGATIGLLGQRFRERDIVTGIVLAFSLGLGALFLSLYTGGDANLAVSILFGEILGVNTAQVVLTAFIGVATLAVVASIYRPLLFASVDEDVAAARRVPVRALSVAFMLTLALTVAMAVQVVGVLLIFALVVAPAAAAERLTSSPGRALLLGVAIALASTWLGLAAAYYLSFYFRIPASFCIVTLSTGTYAGVRLWSWLDARRRQRGRTRSTASMAVRFSSEERSPGSLPR